MHVPRRALIGPLSLAVALTLSLTGGAPVAFAAKPHPKPSPGKPPTAAAVDPTGSIAAARVAARSTGRRVEAVSERSEVSTTWVNPDGTLTTELAAGPVRFLRDGAWTDVDLTLKQAPDGSVAPAAHPHAMKLAGPGGKRPRTLAESQAVTAPAAAEPARTLVSLGSGDDELALEWKGGLPAPELDGPRAVYRDAIGDGAGDLVIEANRTGFEQFVTLKQRPANGNYSYTMPFRAKGLKAVAQPDGGVLFTDRKNGHKRAVLPAPVMWDATTAAGSSEHPRQAKVDLKVVQHGDDVDLVFTPDAAFLADPATAYPVTVDPSTTGLGNALDTRIQKGETVDWSADVELYWGNPGTKNADGSSREARSLINWNTSSIADALVQNATLSLYNIHSGNTDCLPYTWEVWDTGLASTASRWTNQPAWNAKKATSTETKGRDNCGGDGWITANVTDLVQSWASAKSQVSGMGLRAPDEVNTKFWKEVNSANAATNVPKLTVNYNYRPRTGTKQEAGPPFLQDGTGTWRVDTTTPVLRDTFVDPDGDKVTGTFQLVDAISGAQVGNVNVSGYVASGTPAEVTVPAGLLQYGHTYRFRTSPYDGMHYNLGWSAWSTFSVSPLPDVPSKLQTGAQQTLTPVLSALVTNPNQGRIRTEFVLKGKNGQPLPTSITPAWAESGTRASVQVPDGAVTDGGDYTWAVRACAAVGCSAWTADQPLAVRVQAPPVQPAPTTVVLTGAALADASVATDGGGCGAGACPAADPAELRIGTMPDGSSWTSWLKPDLSGVPAGSRVIGGKLALTRSDCAAGTAGCDETAVDVFQLGSAWAPGQDGAALTAAAGAESYASAAKLPETDLAALVGSWIEKGEAYGLALRPPAGWTGTARYSSATAADPAKRPKLTLDYLAPTAPGAAEQVAAVGGDGALVVTWNAPADRGSVGEVGYTVRVETSAGVPVQEVTTGDLRASFTGLDNARSYRAVVTARNGYGAAAPVASAVVQGTPTAGGPDQYRGYVQEYLDARNKIKMKAGFTAPDAAAEAAHGTVFVDLLATQEASLVANREALATQNQLYTAAAVSLTDVVVDQQTAGKVVVRATVKDSVMIRSGGVDSPSESVGAKRFEFTVGTAAVLVSEADDLAAQQQLSSSAAAQAQVEVADAAQPDPADAQKAVPLDANGFPVQPAQSAAGAVQAGYNYNGTADWARRNVNIGWDFSQDCTNFVSKALYYGGGMRPRYGFKTWDSAWWTNDYWLFGWHKNRSYTWAGAANLHRHLLNYRYSTWLRWTSEARPGDVVFFKWRDEPRINHAAVVVSWGARMELRQHGRKGVTTLNEVLSYYRQKGEPIEWFVVVRPLGTN
ncbi:DNRLRE domain-containing protein [Streptomyces sp. FH025]|uniref:DNRLRE domain-containing protein n=1 Tax=Streptomyces sp. FH025 TaxID=2815937 RepID=UPI001A9D7655|nr:DNRLRE domain-containing protein [Streptomyces sp. FH025]MBO1416961.1 DNRLRE domain-containing protein [Streptomyces sp. FH025]